jgi:rfaE bifunctional protein nucleotidyltransferase chain/domain
MIKRVDPKDTAFIQWRFRVGSESGKVFVFTNGCFDVLHPGHIKLLQYAKSLGDFLVVGLNADESIKHLKGKSRPIHKLADRVLMLTELSSVDFIVPFEEDQPIGLIQALQPNFLVKGGDYKMEEIVGASLIRSWGGLVRIYPIELGHSTTSIIQKLTQET